MTKNNPALAALKKLKVLSFDLETAYMLAEVWRTGEQYISHDSLVEGHHYVRVIVITYKWLNEKKVHALTWDKNQDCSKIVEQFDKELEQADIVIGQNHESFDIKHLNTQRLLNNLPPLVGWTKITEDTKKMVKKHFNLPSSALDYLSKYVIKTKGKKKMEKQDWRDIQFGAPEVAARALKKMVSYGKKDVLDTEKVFLKILPYCKPKLNMGVVTQNPLACHRCGGTNLSTLRKSYTATQVMQEYRCKDCKVYACRAPIGASGLPGKKGRA